MTFDIRKELNKLRGPACPCGCETGEWQHDGRVGSWDNGAKTKALIIAEFDKLKRELELCKGQK